MYKCITFLAVAAAFSHSWPAFAQAADSVTEASLARSESFSPLDAVVVTASRREQQLGDIAAQVEIVDQDALEQTSGSFLTDILKKNSSVDIIQYPGGLSGVGMRGFRPEFSGINQRVLSLVDGRPAGVTSLGNMPRAGISRVEVLKGSASALYGASAMGGVVNFISRESKGDLSGAVTLGGGSFDTFIGEARIGGSLTPSLDFDLAYAERSQYDDFDMGRQRKVFGDFVQGDGAERPNTSFQTRSLYGRLGADLGQGWRLDASGHGFFGRDVESPGPESDGIGDQAERDVDAFGGDIALTGRVGGHALMARTYHTAEADDRYDKPVDRPVFLAATRRTHFTGIQLQDTVRLSDDYDLLFGFDYERATNENRSFESDGTQEAAYWPDDTRRTLGVYAEATGRWLDDRLILNLGARFDNIRSEVRDTPLREDLTPGSSSFDTFNPRAGIVLYPLAERSLRLHASAGTGFVVPQAVQVAGITDESIAGQQRIARGNPDLKPESSESYDAGIGYQGAVFGGDLTWFRTDVKDKIESVFVTNTATLRETTYVNASQALAEGFEATGQLDLSALAGTRPGSWTIETTGTYFYKRRQDLPGGEEILRNIARYKINVALAYDGPRFGFRVNGRYVEGAQDRDYSADGIFTGGNRGALFEYPTVFVVDLDARWRVMPGHELALQIDNLSNEYYFEKNDYPAPGRAFYLTYNYQF